MALDPQYNNVSLLLPMEGANNQLAFHDYSSSPVIVTPAGNAKISTTQSKWGAGSGYFDGSGDYLSIPSSTAFNFGAGAFTIEGYFRLAGNQPAYAGLVTKRDTATSNHAWSIAFNNASISIPTSFSFGYSLNGTSASYTVHAAAIVSGQWHHFAFSRIGSALYVGFDGVVAQYAISASAIYASSNVVRVGRLGSAAASEFYGYLQDIRITNGVARYTANYTPPGRLLSPEMYGAKYLHRGTLPTLTPITGNCIVSGNGGAQEVIIREAATRLLVATATPNATTGAWTADVPPGDYDITYFAPDCQPVCHGPYTVTA